MLSSPNLGMGTAFLLGICMGLAGRDCRGRAQRGPMLKASDVPSLHSPLLVPKLSWHEQRVMREISYSRFAAGTG